MIEQLRQRARELLSSGTAAMVIGYGQGADSRRTFPIFVTKPDDVDRLVFNPFCTNNLARYLTRKEVAARGKLALVARPQEIRAVSVLVQENQFQPDGVILIGVWCEEPGREGAACSMLAGTTLVELEAEIASRQRGRDLSPEALAAVKELEAMAPHERWKFWEKEFARCIRCYACRQACPLCYCEQCLVEKNQPQWVPSSPHTMGNYLYNVHRAFHLAGRCTLCGACEEACPMRIPLGLLNKKLAQEIRDHYAYEAGYDHTAPPPLASFRTDDQEDFIR
jgi:formate dehydrogenase (coenzyme F420) beta subunit